MSFQEQEDGHWYCIQAGREFDMECPLEYCIGVEDCPLLIKFKELHDNEEDF